MPKRRLDADGEEILTNKERRFVEEYPIDWNATAAAKRAGYSSHSATAIGRENLLKPHIQRAIERHMLALAAKVGITKERVLAEFGRVAFADIRNIARWRPNVTVVGRDPDGEGEGLDGDEETRAFNEVELVASHEMSPDDAAAIQEISLSSQGTLKVKMHSKMAALDGLAKQLGLYKDQRDPGAAPVVVIDAQDLARRVAFVLRTARAGSARPAGKDGAGSDRRQGVVPKRRPAD